MKHPAQMNHAALCFAVRRLFAVDGGVAAWGVAEVSHGMAAVVSGRAGDSGVVWADDVAQRLRCRVRGGKR